MRTCGRVPPCPPSAGRRGARGTLRATGSAVNRGLFLSRVRAPGNREVFVIKTVTLTENYEFKRVYQKGRSFVNPAAVVYILKNRKGINRVGITTSRKIGKAVQRNRARRVLREAYRAIAPSLPQGYDLVFVARARTATLKEQEIHRVLRGIFGSAKLLPARPPRAAGENSAPAASTPAAPESAAGVRGD